MSDLEQSPPDHTEPRENTAEEEIEAEDRFKKLTAITLATLALLGAGIAVVMSQASTNESTTAREATRTAAKAETAHVLAEGALQAREQAQAEVATMPLRPGLAQHEQDLDALGVETDPAQLEALLEHAEEEVSMSMGDGTGLFDLQVEGNRLSLQQSALVDERVTWNARASQYETVVTVLGVALFLIGFTVLVRRRSRPPLFVPGILLAIYCVGWTAHIYRKPIPEVTPAAIESSALGQAYVDNGSVLEAQAAFTEAIDADGDYMPPYQGRATARLLLANPDIATTLAITNDDPEATAGAVADLARASELADEPNALTLALQGYAAITLQDWSVAATTFDEAIALSPGSPGIQFARSGVAVAMGDDESARRFRDDAFGSMSAMEGSSRDEGLVSSYLSLLSYVAFTTPDQEPLAVAITDEVIISETEFLTGPPTGVAPPGATIAIDELSFDAGITTFKSASSGLGPEDVVTLIGYERPAADAAFIQSEELTYIGPPSATGGGLSFRTPRACAPIAYHFDIWINGVRQAPLEWPGVSTPTC